MKEGLCLVGVRGIYSVYVYWHCACENNTHSLCKVMDLPGWSNEYSLSLCILLRLSVQNLFEFDLTNFISNPHWDIRFSFINSHILSLSLSLSQKKWAGASVPGAAAVQHQCSIQRLRQVLLWPALTGRGQQPQLSPGTPQQGQSPETRGESHTPTQDWILMWSSGHSEKKRKNLEIQAQFIAAWGCGIQSTEASPLISILKAPHTCTRNTDWRSSAGWRTECCAVLMSN